MEIPTIFKNNQQENMTPNLNTRNFLNNDLMIF